MTGKRSTSKDPRNDKLDDDVEAAIDGTIRRQKASTEDLKDLPGNTVSRSHEDRMYRTNRFEMIWDRG